MKLRDCIALFRRSKPKRLEMLFVTYAEGDRLIREEGWQLALPEEDHNRVFGMVFVERVESEEEK